MLSLLSSLTSRRTLRSKLRSPPGENSANDAAFIEALDEVSFGDWLRDHGQGDASIERFWDLIVLPTCNDRSDRVSAALAMFAAAQTISAQVAGVAFTTQPASATAASRPQSISIQRRMTAPAA